jgi:hypothetical protein
LLSAGRFQEDRAGKTGSCEQRDKATAIQPFCRQPNAAAPRLVPGFPALQQRQLGAHFLGGLVPDAEVALACLQNDFVEFEQSLLVSELVPIRRQFRKCLALAAHADFVKDLSEAVEIGLCRARSFRRHVAFGANERAGFSRASHQTDVRQFGHAVYKDDVRWFDVTVDGPLPMDVLQRGG